jgi:hypothetical protein
MGVAASLPRRAARPWALLSSLVQLGAAPLLAGLVATSTLVRGLTGTLKETPAYFPDEYLYAELARSIAETGEPLVRGESVGFPALLQPILTAPAWFLDDVGAAYTLVKWIGALAVSLAAVPAYLLARRLGLGKALALAAAALALATPSLFYASWVMGEPFAYPLVLVAAYAATVALADRNRRAGIAFVACAGLAAFSRAQFMVLPACFLLALLVVGLRGRSLRQELRAQALPLALFAGPVILLLAVPARVVGSYGAFLDVHVDPLRLVERVATNAVGLAYASGWILVPGALLGIGLALTRPRSRTELAFGAITLSITAALLLQASAYGDVDRIQERYTFYGAPLLALAFALFVARGWPARRAHALLAAGALGASAAVPLAFHAADAAKSQSAFLFGVHRLEQLLGSDGSGGLAVAAVAAGLSLAVGILALRPRIATAVVPALALCFLTAASILAVDFDRRNTSGVRDLFLPEDPSWIDRADVGEVALVRGLGLKTDAIEQLFWNRSLDRVLLLPGARPFDVFAEEPLSFAPDGTLVAGRRPVRSALLVDEWATRIELHGASPVASSPGFRLWRAEGTPRLALYALGYYQDGWLALRTGLNVWASPGRRLAGRLSFVVSAPKDLPAPVRLRAVEGDRPLLTLRLRPGESRRVRIAVCGERAWFGALLADRGIVLGDRSVSVRATPPRFRAEAAACR